MKILHCKSGYVAVVEFDLCKPINWDFLKIPLFCNAFFIFLFLNGNDDFINLLKNFVMCSVDVVGFDLNEPIKGRSENPPFCNGRRGSVDVAGFD